MSQAELDALSHDERNIYTQIFRGYMTQIGRKVPDGPMCQGWLQDARRIARYDQIYWGQQIAGVIQKPPASSGPPAGPGQYYNPPAQASHHAANYYAVNQPGGYTGGNVPQYAPAPPSLHPSLASAPIMQAPRSIAPPPSDAGSRHPHQPPPSDAGSRHSRQPPPSDAGSRHSRQPSVHSAGGGKVASIREWAESASNAPPPSIAGSTRSEARSHHSVARAPSVAGTIPESVRSGSQRGGGTVRAASEAGSRHSRTSTSTGPRRQHTVTTIETETVKTSRFGIPIKKTKKKTRSVEERCA